MKKKDVLSVLRKDEKDENGEILDKTKDDVTYYDYNTCTTTWFRFEEACSDDYIKGLIHIGEHAASKGLTKDYIISVLKKAFAEDYSDAVCTLAGIIIPSNKEEFNSMLKATIRTSDDVNEWYDYDDYEHYVGIMLTEHQIVFINEPVIEREAANISVSDYEKREEYQIGLLVTLIHEMRHLMLETNPFLPEYEFPEEMKDEDEVEEFARSAYEKLDRLKYWR